MGFRKNNWASVWSVEEGRGNTMKVRLSTSYKRKDTGEYEQDFSGFCTFIGNAKAKAEKLKVRDRIKLGDVDVTTYYNTDKGVEYVTYKVFDFEIDGNHTSSSEGNNSKRFPGLEDAVEDGGVDEDDLPF